MRLAESDVTSDSPLEEQEAEWRRISGNAPSEERGPEPEPDDDEEKEKEPRKRPPTKPIIDDGTADPPPKVFALKANNPDEYLEFVRLLGSVGNDFGTAHDEFATVLEALRRCEKRPAPGGPSALGSGPRSGPARGRGRVNSGPRRVSA
jgi:hypothetical protein